MMVAGLWFVGFCALIWFIRACGEEQAYAAAGYALFFLVGWSALGLLLMVLA